MSEDEPREPEPPAEPEEPSEPEEPYEPEEIPTPPDPMGPLKHDDEEGHPGIDPVTRPTPPG